MKFYTNNSLPSICYLALTLSSVWLMSYTQQSPMGELQKQSLNIIAATVSVPAASNQTCLAIEWDLAVLNEASYCADRQQ